MTNKLKLQCALSGEMIQDAVIVDGYICDREQAEARMQQTGKTTRLLTDSFTNSLIEYVAKNGNTIVAINDVDSLYECPIDLAFPDQEASLCLADGRTYTKKSIENALKLNPISPCNRATIKKGDLIKHPFYVPLAEVISAEKAKKQTSIDLAEVLQNAVQEKSAPVNLNRMQLGMWLLLWSSMAIVSLSVILLIAVAIPLLMIIGNSIAFITCLICSAAAVFLLQPLSLGMSSANERCKTMLKDACSDNGNAELFDSLKKLAVPTAPDSTQELLNKLGSPEEQTPTNQTVESDCSYQDLYHSAPQEKMDRTPASVYNMDFHYNVEADAAMQL